MSNSCNERLQYGDRAGLYCTWYDEWGWGPRRAWCMDRCPDEVNPGTDGTDEAILLGMFFADKLVGVTVRDRSRPATSWEMGLTDETFVLSRHAEGGNLRLNY